MENNLLNNSQIDHNDELTKKILDLEQRFSKIENILEKLTHRNAVRVNGAIELPKILKVNSSAFELVDIYNEIPHFLASHAIKVSLTGETYRQNTQGEIFLEKDNNGNYWIIALENNTYWLLPKVNIKLNQQLMKTIKLLFNCHNYKVINTSEFILIKPAEVSLKDNNYNQQYWKLKAIGELEFGSVSTSSQLQLELLEFKKEHQGLRVALTKLSQDNQQNNQKMEDLNYQMEQMLEVLKKQFNHDLQALNSQIKHIENKLLVIENIEVMLSKIKKIFKF